MTERCSELRFSFTGSSQDQDIFVGTLVKSMGISLMFDPPAYNLEEHKFKDQVLISGRCSREQRDVISQTLQGLGVSAPSVRFEDTSKWVITATPDRLVVRFIKFQECLK